MNSVMLKWFIGLVATMFLSSAQIAHAQKLSIVTIVNGEPITSLDLAERNKFLSLITGLGAGEIDVERVRNDALQMLIDERLKFQAGNDLDPTLLSRSRQAARPLMDQNFARDGLGGVQWLKQNGISTNTVLDRVTSDFVWLNVLQATFPRQFLNLDNLAEIELERLKGNLSEPQYQISEIVLVPGQDRNLQQTLSIANDIQRAVLSGADFSAIAQQYSQAGSAQNGGLVGWVQAGRLDNQLKEALEAAQDGDILAPINLDGVVYILRRDGLREKGLLDPSRVRVDLARIVQPLSLEADSETLNTAVTSLEAQLADIQSCDALVALHNSLGSNLGARIQDVQIGELAPRLANKLIEMEKGDISAIERVTEGLVAFMVCERQQPAVNLPSLESLKQAELDKLYSVLNTRLLNRLRRAATIENRGE